MVPPSLNPDCSVHPKCVHFSAFRFAFRLGVMKGQPELVGSGLAFTQAVQVAVQLPFQPSLLALPAALAISQALTHSAQHLCQLLHLLITVPGLTNMQEAPVSLPALAPAHDSTWANRQAGTNSLPAGSCICSSQHLGNQLGLQTCNKQHALC